LFPAFSGPFRGRKKVRLLAIKESPATFQQFDGAAFVNAGLSRISIFPVIPEFLYRGSGSDFKG